MTESFHEYVIRTHSKDIQSIRGTKGGAISKGGGRKIDPLSVESLKPWNDLGVSRRTYYRMLYERKKT